MSDQLTTVVTKLCETRELNEYSCDFQSSGVRTLSVPLRADLNLELRAIAMVLNRDPHCLAADLLHAAIQDARAKLSAELIASIKDAREAIIKSQLPENQPGTDFVAGGT